MIPIYINTLGTMMRLKYLSLCICSFILTACANVAIQPQSRTAPSLDTKATQALNSIYQQPNFNISGYINSNLDIKSTAPTTTATQDISAQKAVIEQYLRLHQLKLTEEEKKALFEQLSYTSAPTNKEIDYALSYFSRFANNAEITYHGGVDYRKKLFQLEFLTKYEGTNALVQARYPLVLDFNQSRIYLNAFEPKQLQHLPEKTQKLHQSYYYDFAQYKDDIKKNIDIKALVEYLKAANSPYFEHLIANERIEQLAPSEEERKQGAVEKIRLHTSLEALIVKSSVFDYVNESYMKKIINVDKLVEDISKTNNKQNQSENQSANAKFFDDYLQMQELINQHYEQLSQADATTKPSAKAETAVEAVEASKAQNPAKSQQPEPKYVEDTDETGLTQAQCEQMIAQKTAFGLLTQCRYEYGSSLFTKPATAEKDSKDTKEPAFIKMMTDILNTEGEFYTTFKAYDKGQLTSGQELTNIFRQHQGIIQSTVPTKTLPMTFDVTLDAQGRLLHNTIQLNLDNHLADIHFKGNVRYQSTISNYGKANLTAPKHLANAKPIQEHPLAEKVNSSYSRYIQRAQNGDLAEHLAKTAYLNSKSYETAYAAAFIASLSEEFPELLNKVSAQELQEIARVYAYSYADEKYYHPTAEQVKQIQALEKKHKLDTSEQMFNTLGVDVAEIVEEIIEEQSVSSEDVAIAKKLKTADAIFAHYYYENAVEEFDSYPEDGEKLTAEQKKQLKQMADILGKAYLAQQQGTLSLEHLKGLTLEHFDLWYAGAYSYSAKQTEKLLKLVK